MQTAIVGGSLIDRGEVFVMAPAKDPHLTREAKVGSRYGVRISNSTFKFRILMTRRYL